MGAAGGGAEVAFKDVEKLDSEEEDEAQDRIKAIPLSPTRSPNRAIRLQARAAASEMGACGQLETTRLAAE